MSSQSKSTTPDAERGTNSESDVVALDLSLTDSYDYRLPETQIATSPSQGRADSRLLVLRRDHDLVDRHFFDLPTYLRPGDLLVRNSVRVLPARVAGRKVTGGRVELLILEPLGAGWDSRGPLLLEAMGRSSRGLKIGQTIHFGQGESESVLSVVDRCESGRLILRYEEGDIGVRAWLSRHGSMPLPPYIRRRRRQLGADEVDDADIERYQTVYADVPGAVAAPTAGLHFTDDIFARLEALGVGSVDVRLDVGPGTFKPVEVETLAAHNMHSEHYVVSELAADAINAARDDGRRIIAVGTTSFRVLEDQAIRGDWAHAGAYDTRLFVRPGVPIRWVDAMITNFHLPRSTLLALVCAFGGHQQVLRAYHHAVAEGYRFYSYGDAMFIERERRL